MKTIQISQLKGETFNINKLIEDTIKVDKENIRKMKEDLLEVILDVESLREALFFKQEKLSIQLRSFEDKIEVDKINDLYKSLEELEINDLGESKEVLERNKEIYELKLVNKIVHYYIEMEKKNFNALKILVKSEDREDWNFLCFFLKITLNVVDFEIKDELLKITREIEEKMLNVFEEGRNTNNKTMMRSSYIALSGLDENHTLIQTFIYGLDIFKKTYKMEHTSVEVVDVDFYDEDNNTFFDFLREIRSSYQENLTDLSDIFPNYEEAYKIINNKIYHDLIFPVLESYLKDLEPFVFLFSFGVVFRNLVNLNTFIESICSTFDGSVMLDELVDRYSAISLEKEKLFFSEIFNCLVFGNKTFKTYIILGKEVNHNNDFHLIIKQLLNLISQFEERSTYLYDKEDHGDMINFYLTNINNFLDNVYDRNEDKIGTILQLQYAYLIVKRFFGERFGNLHIFSNRVENLIKNSFRWKIEQCENRIKQIVDQIFFYRKSMDLYILDYLKEQVNEAKRIKGKNHSIFCKRIFQYAYDRIKKKIFEITFSEDQKKNLKLFIKSFLRYLDLQGNQEIIKLYRYLENVVLLINVPTHDVKEMYDSLKLKLDQRDLKKAIKCRKDRNEINNVLKETSK